MLQTACRSDHYAPSRSATLALSRRDQVNQTFSFFHVRDPTKQAARPRPDSKNDQLAASFSLWWSKSTLHKFLKDLRVKFDRRLEVHPSTGRVPSVRPGHRVVSCKDARLDHVLMKFQKI
ncbi:hypothetical protein F2Q70_00020587 [Brassica cretica]|uniref:Uncharacterized protein n=1 Tax=Brassica cretica TaxID=69181 RepID=A0A8S9GSM1_BRACR|nr:hypothetical protein F2Q70_00020587 [Brassica cretica]